MKDLFEDKTCMPGLIEPLKKRFTPGKTEVFETEAPQANGSIEIFKFRAKNREEAELLAGWKMKYLYEEKTMKDLHLGDYVINSETRNTYPAAGFIIIDSMPVIAFDDQEQNIISANYPAPLDFMTLDQALDYIRAGKPHAEKLLRYLHTHEFLAKIPEEINE